MKNFLITIVTMATAFAIAFYVLTNFYKRDDALDNLSNATFSKAITSKESKLTTPVNTPEETESESYDDNDEVNDLFPDVESILDSDKTWKSYFKKNINLYTDFISLNEEGNEISKGDFLSDLTSGNFVPVKLATADLMYQLYDITDVDNKKISSAIKSEANIAYAYFSKEGTKLPKFNFFDLNGNKFTSENTRGKILIIKCWFINCKVCVEEFPELNDLYDKYEAYEDVVFLSLAFDEADKLRDFLTKKEFRYPVVAKQKSYMKDEIGVIQYPTHLIVDEEGNIEKMVSSVAQLKAALDKIAEPEIPEFNDSGM